MKAGYLTYKINNKILKGEIKDCVYFNTVKQLYGTAQVGFSFKSEEDYIEFIKECGDKADIKIIWNHGTYSTILINGIIVEEKGGARQNNDYTTELEIVHKTFNIEDQKLENGDFLDELEDNAKSILDSILEKAEIKKLVDKVIYPSKVKLLQEVNSSLVAGDGTTVYDFLTAILNELDVSVYTLSLKEHGRNKDILYFYDSGSYIDSLQLTTQTITNNNLIEFFYFFNYKKFYEEAHVKSGGEITNKIKIKNGNTVLVNTDASEEDATTRDLNSFGILQLKNNQRTLPSIVFQKTLKNGADDIDGEQFSRQIIRNMFDDAILIECRVVSLAVDEKRPELGIWQLGAKILITNDLLRNAIKEKAKLYIKDGISRYFFVIKGIDFDYSDKKTPVKLTLGLNDLVRK